VINSVADPGCLYRIPDPDFYPSRIPDQKTVTTEKEVKKKVGPIFKELLKFLPKKFSICYQIYGFGIRDPEKTYSGSRIQGSKRHRIQDPDPQHW
jgi:hypothetical protein